MGRLVLGQKEGVGHVVFIHHISKCSGPLLTLFDQSLYAFLLVFQMPFFSCKSFYIDIQEACSRKRVNISMGQVAVGAFPSVQTSEKGSPELRQTTQPNTK